MTDLSNKELIELSRAKTVEVIDRSDAQMSFNIINMLCDRLEKADKCIQELKELKQISPIYTKYADEIRLKEQLKSE